MKFIMSDIKIGYRKQDYSFIHTKLKATQTCKKIYGLPANFFPGIYSKLCRRNPPPSRGSSSLIEGIVRLVRPISHRCGTIETSAAFHSELRS